MAGTVPFADQVEVPLDTVPSAVFSGTWSCSDADDQLFELVHGASGAVVASRQFTGAEVAERRWISLAGGDVLEPESDYLLRLTTSTSGGEAEETVETPFVTGTGMVAGLSALPTLRSAEASYQDSTGRFSLDFVAEPATDSDELSILQFESDDFRLASVEYETPCSAVVVAGESEISESCISYTGLPPADTCVRVRQIDGHGQPTDWSSDTCVPVAGGCPGCSAGARPPASGWAAILACVVALASTRRRR